MKREKQAARGVSGAVASAPARVGTSGWVYAHWRERFYPRGLPQARWLEHYAERFDTVELNASFYRLPNEAAVAGWARRAPEGFLFACKANRMITHRKRLADCEEWLELFLSRVRLLGPKLGPMLYQLPPGLHRDLERLERFAALLPPEPPAVFEFRHKSWFAEEAREFLAARGLSFCVHDMPGLETPRWATGSTVYARFHGPVRRYAGSYPDAVLAEWAAWLAEQVRDGRRVFAYFNNDAEGHAVRNAQTLRRMLREELGGAG